jgi:hypothetical protein
VRNKGIGPKINLKKDPESDATPTPNSKTEGMVGLASSRSSADTMKDTRLGFPDQDSNWKKVRHTSLRTFIFSLEASLILVA